MKAVILAAGEGARMRPLTFTRPKAMLPLANKPLLEHLLLQVKNAGITEVLLVVGYLNTSIHDYFEDGEQWGLSIQYVTQIRQLGTADAVGTVQNFVSRKFIVLNGDILVNADDIRHILDREQTTLGIIEVANPEDLGVVEVEGDKVISIHEKTAKPPSHLANAGLYLFTEEIFGAIDETPTSLRGERELTTSLQLLANKGQPLYYQLLSYWLNVSYPWDLLMANASLMDRVCPQNQGSVEEQVAIEGQVVVGRGTVIKANSRIIGPVVIGENCEIGPDCHIHPASSIGDDCHIGTAVEIKNSIFLRGNQLCGYNYVGDSVVGERCNFGIGAKVVKQKQDMGDICIDTKGHTFGAIVGDNVQTGTNASIDAGSLIGNNTFIGSGGLASGVVLPNSRIEAV